MADFDNDLIRELIEAMKELRDAQSSGDSAKIDKASSRADKVTKKLESAADIGAKSIKEVSKRLDEMDKRIAKGKATWQEMLQRSKDFSESLDDLNDTSDQAILVKKRVSALEEEAAKKAKSDLKTIAFKQALDGAKKMVSGAGMEFVNGLQSGKSGISMATDLAVTTANLTGDTLGGIGKNVSEVGSSFASAGGKVGTLGKAAVVAGMALSAVGSTAKLMGLAGTVLGKEIEKTVAAFNSATAAGAVYAGGMTELRNTAHSAGLTVTNFANVLKNSSTELAQIGLSVPEATKKMGLAMKAGGDDMKRKMLNLGYSFEDQASLVAETMRSMRSTGGPLQASSGEIAAETQKYAENLKVISAMTGEDAKKRQEAVKAEMNTLAMQQKLSSMPETQRIAMEKSMQNMDDATRKAFIEMQLFGTTVTSGSALMMASNSGFSQRVNELNAAATQGALDEEKTRAINAKTAEQVRKDAMSQTSLGLAGAAGVGDEVGALATTMGKLAKDSLTQTEEARKAAEQATTGQMNATDDLTRSIADANIAGQNLAVAFEEKLTPAIGKFASALESAMTKINEIVKSMGGDGGSSGTGMDMANLALTGMMAAPIGKSMYDKISGKNAPAESGGASGKNYTSPSDKNYRGNALKNNYDVPPESGAKFGKFKKPSIKGVAKGLGIAGILGTAGEYASDYAKEKGHEKTGMALSVGSKAATGASIGMMLGPVGAAIGGVLGAAYGLYDEMSQDKTKTESAKPESISTEGEPTQTGTEITATTFDPIKDEIKGLGNKLDSGNSIASDIKTSINDLKTISKSDKQIKDPVAAEMQNTSSKTIDKFFPESMDNFVNEALAQAANTSVTWNPILGIASMIPKPEQKKEEVQDKKKTEDSVVKEVKPNEDNIKLLTDLNKSVKGLETILTDVSRFTRENRDISEKIYRETT